MGQSRFESWNFHQTLSFQQHRLEIAMDFSKYTNNTVKYPRLSEIKKEYKQKVEETFVGTKKQIDVALEDAALQAEADFKVQREKYYKEQNALQEKFVQDLFEEFGVKDSKKARKAYAIAYEHGHSSGYSEIYNYFIDLAELLTMDD